MVRFGFVVLVILFIAWFLSSRFGSATRAYISDVDGPLSTGMPVHLWPVPLWPLTCLVVGRLIARLFATSSSPSLRIFLSVGATFFAVYGFAICGTLFAGIGGFFGLLAYQGPAESWPPMKFSMIISPVAILISSAWPLKIGARNQVSKPVKSGVES